MARPRKKNRHTFDPVIWHRRLGITAAAWVLWLCITGILLNHAEQLGLNTSHIRSSTILDWYGIASPPPVSYPVGEGWVAQLGARLYFDARPLPGNFTALKGAVELTGRRVIATETQLILLTLSGQVIETMNAPASVQALGALAQRPVIRTASGEYLGDADVSTWERLRSREVRWSQLAVAPAALQACWAQAYRGQGLSWERVLLDLHSGRIVGRPGVWAIDVGALLFLLLAITGLCLWRR